MSSDTVLTQKPLKSPARRLTRADIKQVAELVVKYRMNETEACLECGIRPKQWFLFKHRHKFAENFEVMLNTVRAANIRNCIDAIDESGSDREFTALNKRGEEVTITKPGDWRAKAWIAERVLAADRFGDRQAPATNVNVQVFAQIDAVLSKVYAEPSKQVVDIQEVKQLPGGTPTSSPSGREQR